MSEVFTPGRPHLWQWLTVLSLDAPIVAVLWQAMFARVARVTLRSHHVVVLGLAVWVIYIADRWIDGFAVGPENVRTQRHHFYIRFRWPVLGLGILLVISGAAVAALFLTEREFKAGTLLVIPVVAYLLSHQWIPGTAWRIPKEACVAVLFALGTALSPIAFAFPDLGALYAPLALFALLCFSNCTLISAWERDVDLSHGQSSFALKSSRRLPLIKALPWMIAVSSVGFAVTAAGPTRVAALCSATSAILLAALDRAEPRLGREVARALVDVTLMTPAVALLLN